MTISQTPEGLPDKKETVESVQDETNPSSMASKSIRQFHSFDITKGNEVKILSARTGKPVTITLRNMNNYQKELLSKVCDFIEGKLSGTEYGEDISQLMLVTVFCVTSSKHVGGFSVEYKDQPIVIFNSKVITGSFDEFALTVLHELLHFIQPPGNGDPSSIYEARHDIACYGFLGIPIRTDHWAFVKYPELLEQLSSEIEKNKGEQK